jgi:hypothetical protein
MKNPSGAGDGKAFEALLEALYASISFGEGERPDFGRLRSLLLPGARLVRVQPAGVETMDVDGFIASFEQHLASGALTEFRESEIARRVDRFGHMAHVFSTYATRLTMGGVTSERRGINSIQLALGEEGWKVLTIFWMDESGENPIPPEYLQNIR